MTILRTRAVLIAVAIVWYPMLLSVIISLVNLFHFGVDVLDFFRLANSIFLFLLGRFL